MSFIKYIFIILFLGVLLFPLVWMFKGSLENMRGLIMMPPTIIPKKPSLDNYKALFFQGPRGKQNIMDLKYIRRPINWFKNTLIVLFIKLALVIVTVTTAGYAFSIYKFKYNSTLFLIFVAGMVLPPVTLIPSFVAVKKLGLYNTLWALILPGTYNAIGMYMMKNYIDTIPRSFIDSARIDGAGEITILTRLILPLCKPPIGIITIIVTMQTLACYIWSMMVLPDSKNWTWMVGIMSCVRTSESAPGGNGLGLTLASGVVMFIPLFIVFVLCQKYFITGIKIQPMEATMK